MFFSLHDASPETSTLPLQFAKKNTNELQSTDFRIATKKNININYKRWIQYFFLPKSSTAPRVIPFSFLLMQ